MNSFGSPPAYLYPTLIPAETLGTIPVAILDDALDENDEDFTLSLSNPQSAVAGYPVTVTVTITDDDLPPEVYLTEAAVTVDEGDGTVALGVELSAPSALEVAVDFTAADGLATALMVSGADAGGRLIEKMDDCGAYLVTKDGRQIDFTGASPSSLSIMNVSSQS